MLEHRLLARVENHIAWVRAQMAQTGWSLRRALLDLDFIVPQVRDSVAARKALEEFREQLVREN